MAKTFLKWQIHLNAPEIPKIVSFEHLDLIIRKFKTAGKLVENPWEEF